ncbi:sensor histidine kinase [Paenibacillus chartarius]|uniref:histidine kinase n=1 Tax=Paenibacillus chartarius TaxID=747481 RepID=A0ABV6DME0_9BACL
MVILFLLLWILATILVTTNPTSEATRWGGAVAFFSGFGGLADVMDESVSPFLREWLSEDHAMIGMAQGAVGVFSSLSHYISPYVLLMFSFRCTGVWTKNRVDRIISAIVFFLPIPVMYALFPVYPQLQADFRLLTLWVAPYVLTANFLMIRSAIREGQTLLKRQKGMLCVIVSPLTLFSLLTNYVLRVFHVEEAWRYNTWMIILGFIAFLYFAARYGLLGVRLRFEKQSLESTMRAVSMGTSFLNHTIKNEITKISMSTDNLLVSTAAADPNTKEQVEIIAGAAAHMLAMAERIQEHVQELVLNEETVRMSDLIERALLLCRPLMDAKQIHVNWNAACTVYLRCDPVHLTETLVNVIRNAVDAMSAGGELTISVAFEKKQLIVSVQDNGTGISKEHLAFVFEPFFTTKPNRSNHFGLGLSYVYNVMRKHGGSLDIHSLEGEGTTVYLRFPIHAIVDVSADDREEEHDGKHSRSHGRRRSGLDQDDDELSASSARYIGSRIGDEQGRGSSFDANAII